MYIYTINGEIHVAQQWVSVITVKYSLRCDFVIGADSRAPNACFFFSQFEEKTKEAAVCF